MKSNRGGAITLREGHAAVNVKVYRLDTPDGYTDQQREIAFEITQERFWSEATEAAHKRGYAGVFTEGRSGGWCVPFYQRSKDGRTKFYSWPGQGPDHGYPRYPDVEHNSAEREKFRAFQRDIQRLLSEVQANYTYDLEHLEAA